MRLQALDRYPMVAEPGSPLPGSLSPGPKSHRIHITASPSHSYAPAAARKLDTDTHPNNAAHGFVPPAPPGQATAATPGGAAAVNSLPLHVVPYRFESFVSIYGCIADATHECVCMMAC